MSGDQTLPESERVDGLARRLLADIVAYARGPIGISSHSCRGYDHELRCNVCGRDGKRAPDAVTLFVGVLGQWWVNEVGGGRPIEYVPASLVLPVLRAFLAQRDELRKLRTELQGLTDLLRKCQSGFDLRCPVCSEQWRNGHAQPHAADCALAKAIAP